MSLFGYLLNDDIINDNYFIITIFYVIDDDNTD